MGPNTANSQDPIAQRESSMASITTVSPGTIPSAPDYVSIKGPEIDLSSEGESSEPPRSPLEDARSVIGVSIGHAQTRLASSQTPAAEKAAAMDTLDGGFFWDDGHIAVEGNKDDMSSSSNPSAFAASPTATAHQPTVKNVAGNDGQVLPPPWRYDPKLIEKPESARSILRDSLGFSRRRASSGPSTLNGANQKRPIQFSFPSLPSLPQPLSFFSNHKSTQSLQRMKESKPKRSNTLSSNPPSILKPSWNGNKEQNSATTHQRHISPQETNRALSRTDITPNVNSGLLRLMPQVSCKTDSGGGQAHISFEAVAQVDGSQDEQPLQLRRVTSDSSLYIRRTVSRVSSLGDDSRFEHVQDQVNSRLKAIKDSFQDSSFKLPSLPSLPSLSSLPSMPNFGLNGLRMPDFSLPSIQRNNTQSTMAGLPTNGRIKADNLAVTVRENRSNPVAKPTLPKVPSHPYFSHALDGLVGDIVIMGGYRGSILRSAKPPHRQLWIPVKVGLNLRKVDLEIGLNQEDEETMEEHIIPSGMLTHIGPVDISRRLIKKLRQSANVRSGKARIWDYGYDWRLSPHLLSRKFITFLEGLPSNSPDISREQRGVTVIAHSLGGLITRHAVNNRPDLFAGVVYAGVPQACINILGPLRNGDEVLLSSKVLTAQVNFTIRSSYVLLPEDGNCFIDKNTKERYPVDFFNVNTWLDNCLSPCITPPVPPTNTTRARGSLVTTMYDKLPGLPIPGRKPSTSYNKNTSPDMSVHSSAARTKKVVEASVNGARTKAANAVNGALNENNHTLAPQMAGQQNSAAVGESTNSNVSTTVTIPQEDAIAYLRRTLVETKQFKQELHYRSDHAERNAYPPIAVMYGRSIPTVYGARVNGKESIKHADAYDDLAFASGDGVCLAKAAMPPKGYPVVRGGKVASERGHVTLLGDLEGVGRCLSAVMAGRIRGIGLGMHND